LRSSKDGTVLAWGDNEAGQLANSLKSVLLKVDSTFDGAGGLLDLNGLDRSPEPFVFASQSGVAPLSMVTSNAVTITGLGGPTPIVMFESRWRVFDQRRRLHLGCRIDRQ
jgi:hypothetical protein